MHNHNRSGISWITSSSSSRNAHRTTTTCLALITLLTAILIINASFTTPLPLFQQKNKCNIRHDYYTRTIAYMSRDNVDYNQRTRLRDNAKEEELRRMRYYKEDEYEYEDGYEGVDEYEEEEEEEEEYYYEEDIDDEDGGNYWSNPKGGYDAYYINDDDEDEDEWVEDYTKRRPRSTFRSGSPDPPSFLSDFYNQFFWYGMDMKQSTSPRDKTVFGGTRGKFNGLQLLYGSYEKRDPPSGLRRRRRPPPPRRRRTVDAYDDDYYWEEEEEEEEYYAFPKKNKQPWKPVNKREKALENEISSWFQEKEDDDDYDTPPQRNKAQSEETPIDNMENFLDNLFQVDSSKRKKMADAYNRNLKLGKYSSTASKRSSRVKDTLKYEDDGVQPVADYGMEEDDATTPTPIPQPMVSTSPPLPKSGSLPPKGVQGWDPTPTNPNTDQSIPSENLRQKILYQTSTKLLTFQKQYETLQYRYQDAQEEMMTYRKDYKYLRKKLLDLNREYTATSVKRKKVLKALRTLRDEMEEVDFYVRKLRGQMDHMRRRIGVLEEKYRDLSDQYEDEEDEESDGVVVDGFPLEGDGVSSASPLIVDAKDDNVKSK